MDRYENDVPSFSLFGLDLTDLQDFPIAHSSPANMFSSSSSSSIHGSDESRVLNYRNREKNNLSPPKHRHDGTSPLPLGLDWSPPPRIWDGRNSVWPHDSRTGWSYCVTIPSWTIIPTSRGSDPVVFYRLLIGLQSPQGVTTTRGILRRFSHFLKLSSDLKKAFPKKRLPPSPSKGLLKIKGRELMEERRCSLEDWMSKVLSDIDLSRSAPIAIFLELEASARSAFDGSIQNLSELNSSTRHDDISTQFSNHSGDDAHTSFASDHGNDSISETSDLGIPRHVVETFSDLGDNVILPPYSASPPEEAIKNSLSQNDVGGATGKVVHGSQGRILYDNIDPSRVVSYHEDQMDLLFEAENLKIASRRERRLSSDSLESGSSFAKPVQISHLWGESSLGISSSELPEAAGDSKRNLQFPYGINIVLPSDEQHKMNRVLSTMRQRLATAKTDMEDLIARLNQELAVRQYLTTKVKDLEVELETTKENGKENLQHAILTERERSNQLQWDMEELRRKCMEMELKLRSEQDENLSVETKVSSMTRKNEELLHELEVSRQQLENLHKKHEESELKSKADIKLLVKEVKSLRSSQSEWKQELSKLVEEKTEVERILQKERRIREQANAANEKLLHECEILRRRLEECSVSYLIEEETKLTTDGPSASKAIDVLVTSDNRLGLLLAEAQLLAQDVENANVDAGCNINGGNTRKTDDELRRMLADLLIDNARLRKQVNSVIHHSLSTPDISEKVDHDSPSKRTILSKFLER